MTHRFATGGSKTISMTVRNAARRYQPDPAGHQRRQLVRPQAVLQVISGAEPDGSGGWITDDQQAVTFDGNASLGDYEEWQWLDETTGATASGPRWTVTLDGGMHVITLTVVSNRQGGLRSSASVSVDVLIVEQAPVEVRAIIGDALGEGLAAEAWHPFDRIARIQLFGRFVGVCIDQNGVETPYDVDRRGATPLVEAAPGEISRGPGRHGHLLHRLRLLPSRRPARAGQPGRVLGGRLHRPGGDRGESEHIIRP